MRRLLVGLMLALPVAACSNDSSSTAPSPAPQTLNLAGTWVGTVPVQDTTAQMTWTLSQSNSADLSGPVIIGLTTGTVFVNGFLTGTLSGPVLAYTISVGPGGIPLSPTCVGQLGGTLTVQSGTPTAMAGSYEVRSSTCEALIPSGTVTMTRR